MNKTRPKQNASEHRAELIRKVAAAEQARDSAVKDAELAAATLSDVLSRQAAHNATQRELYSTAVSSAGMTQVKLDAALQLLRDYDSIRTAAQHKDWTARWRKMTGK